MLQDLHDLKYKYGMCGLFLLSLAKFSHKPKHLPNSLVYLTVITTPRLQVCTQQETHTDDCPQTR